MLRLLNRVSILNLSEEIKHGFEFVGDSKPNSDLINGKLDSGYKILQKENIRYDAFRQDFEKNVNPISSTDKLPSKKEYICYYDSNEPQYHRKNQHSAARGI